MKWYYKVLGDHTHIRVMLNGALCGMLCFRNEEFLVLQTNHQTMSEDSGASKYGGLIEFINES